MEIDYGLGSLKEIITKGSLQEYFTHMKGEVLTTKSTI